MAFDWNAHPDAPTAGGFDWNAHPDAAAQDDGPSSLDSLARGAAQGATFNFADEIAGGGEALLDKLKGSNTPFADAYRKHRDESRANFAAAEKANPAEYGAGQVAGGLGVGLAAAPFTGGASLGSAVALGAGSGALNALGESKDLDKQALINAGEQGLIGAGTGVLGYGAGKVLGKGLDALGSKITGAGEAGVERAEQGIAAKAAGQASEGVDSALGTLGKTTAESFKGVDRAEQLLARGNLSPEEAAPLRELLASERVKGLDKNLAGNLSRDLGGQLDQQSNARALYEEAVAQYPDEVARLTKELGSPKAAVQQLMPLLKRYGAVAAGGVAGMAEGLPGGALVGAGLRPALRAIGRRATTPEVSKQVFNIVGKVGRVLKVNPQALGRYGGVLANAARQGPDALNVAHFVLGQSDPGYQKVVGEIDDNGAYDDEPIKMADGGIVPPQGEDSVTRPQLDWSQQFNTPLSPADKVAYQAWLVSESARRRRDVTKDPQDYDLQGYWKDIGRADTTGQGHMTDTFKKPNHPTFSDESKYSGTLAPWGGSFQGGKWDDTGYTPSPDMLAHTHNPDDMQDYFDEAEPGMKLRLPKKKP